MRRHRMPIHCDRCQTVFESESDRAAHCRSTPICEVVPVRDWDCITEAQKRLLSERVSGRKSKEENWFTIFEILFPGAPKPRSPYLDPDFADGLLALREFAVAEVPGIVTQLVAENSLQDSLPFDFNAQSYTETVVQDAIEILLARFESRMPLEQSLATSHSSDSGYGGSSLRGTIRAQSTQSAVNPEPPSMAMTIDYGSFFAGFQRDQFSTLATEQIDFPNLPGQFESASASQFL